MGNFTGRWFTNFGAMELTQQGDGVRGTYGNAGGAECNGYALIEVSPQAVNLFVKDSEGKTKLNYTVQAK